MLRTQEVEKEHRLTCGSQFQQRLAKYARLNAADLQLLAIGERCDVGAAGLVTGILYEVSPADPITFSGISVLLLGIAGLACYAPARRAMSVDPIVALRTE